MMSSFTAFVAVNATTRTAGDSGTTVAISLPVAQVVPHAAAEAA